MIKLRKKLLNCFAFMCTTIVVVLGVANIAPVVKQKSDLEERRLELIEEICRTEKEVRELREMQNDFKTDYEFVEYILHENNHVWKNETIFVFEE
ncbi:MAG: hypothetical protein R6V06_02270 [Kiritimatiellia bacterium]